jgi:hypothetical protein
MHFFGKSHKLLPYSPSPFGKSAFWAEIVILFKPIFFVQIKFVMENASQMDDHFLFFYFFFFCGTCMLNVHLLTCNLLPKGGIKIFGAS